MPIKLYKPTSPGRRGMTVSTFEEITATTPQKSLLRPMRKQAGRNFRGKVTVRHQGGGHKRRYRVIDFKRDKQGVPGRISTIEYDPNRSARIALVVYADGDKRYIPAPLGLKVGDVVMSGPQAEVRVGNAMPIANIPVGSIDPQRRAPGRARWADRPCCRHLCPVAGQRGALCSGPAALW